MFDPLPAEFYLRPTLEVARELLGKLIVRRLPGGDIVSGIIVETDAYLTGDPASHTYRGLTPRNAVMFGPPGRAYVYLSYGLHNMLNIVCGPAGVGEAVLIRALEPLDGIETMRTLRGGIGSRFGLSSGPGKLGQALQLSVAGDNGLDVTSRHSAIQVCPGPWSESFEIVETKRIGISVGVDSPWRYYVKGNPHVSR